MRDCGNDCFALRLLLFSPWSHLHHGAGVEPPPVPRHGCYQLYALILPAARGLPGDLSCPSLQIVPAPCQDLAKNLLIRRSLRLTWAASARHYFLSAYPWSLAQTVSLP
jgi:hypothetical protein